MLQNFFLASVQKNKHNNQKRAKKELCIKRTIKRSPHKEKRESGYFKKATNKNSPLTKKFHKIFHQPFFSSYLLQKVTSQNVNNARSTTLSEFFISHFHGKAKVHSFQQR